MYFKHIMRKVFAVIVSKRNGLLRRTTMMF